MRGKGTGKMGLNFDIRKYFEELLEKCNSIFASSLTTPNAEKVAASHVFIQKKKRS